MVNDSVSPYVGIELLGQLKQVCVWLKIDPQINCVPEVHLLMKLLFGNFSGKKSFVGPSFIFFIER